MKFKNVVSRLHCSCQIQECETIRHNNFTTRPNLYLISVDWSTSTIEIVSHAFSLSHIHKAAVHSVSWNKNGNWLLTASKDSLIKVYDIRMMKELFTLKGHKKEVTSKKSSRIFFVEIPAVYMNKIRSVGHLSSAARLYERRCMHLPAQGGYYPLPPSPH